MHGTNTAAECAVLNFLRCDAVLVEGYPASWGLEILSAYTILGQCVFMSFRSFTRVLYRMGDPGSTLVGKIMVYKLFVASV